MSTHNHIMRRRIYALFFMIIIMTLTQCSAGPEWRLAREMADLDHNNKAYVCLDLPAAQIDAGTEAVLLWDSSLKNWKRIIPITSGNESYCAYWVHETSREHDKNPNAMAWTSMVGGREIFMRIGWYEKATKGVLLHELGHAFGAQHIQGTLMNPWWTSELYLCPDVQTVAQVAAFHGINLDILSWCVL